MLKQPAFIPLPPPPLPPPGIAPLPPTIGRQPRNDPMAVTPTSIRIFNTKKVKTKPKQTNTNYFDQNKHKIKEIQEQTLQRIRALTENEGYYRPNTDIGTRRSKKNKSYKEQCQENDIYDDFVQNVALQEVNDKPDISPVQPDKQLIQQQPIQKIEIQEKQVNEQQKHQPPQQEEQQQTVEQKALADQESAYMRILNRYKRKGRDAVKKDAFDNAGGFNDLGDEPSCGSGGAELSSDDDLEALLRFVEDRNDGEEMLSSDELRQLKQKVDEKYAKQNKFQDKAGPNTFQDNVQSSQAQTDIAQLGQGNVNEARQTYQKQMTGISGFAGLSDVNSTLAVKKEPQERVREYYDIADIELESSAIRDRFTRRHHNLLVTAPHLQPFVFRTQ